MKILYYILITASLLALLLNRKRLDRRLYLFIPLLIITPLPDGLDDLVGEESLLYQFFFAIYTPFEYFVLSFVIASYLKNRTWKKIIYISIPLFIIASAIIQLWLKQYGFFFKFLDVFIEAPLIVAWSLFYLFQLAEDRKELLVKNNPMFWICIGNILAYSASAFSYGFGSYLHEAGKTDYSNYVFLVAKIFNIVLYAIYIIAFLCTWKRTHSS